MSDIISHVQVHIEASQISRNELDDCIVQQNNLLFQKVLRLELFILFGLVRFLLKLNIIYKDDPQEF